ncbi:hypothetical protein B0J13DRAFT_94185 [Dactylonectria estremocensis]|uniref:Enoyl reductase (ER) domain-containing protein n=1 Tax=Dactylonectria estremocensis TaxID=1079267 RepID=A0A9P9IUT2_9HYPO|nr:hypothetical protein B0J13DRAFT_94185 [Dactylonectria estremocensis]
MAAFLTSILPFGNRATPMSLPKVNKQWTTDQNGLDKLQPTEANVPKPKDGEVLVKVLAVALNYRDTEVVMGLYNHHSTIQDTEQLVPCSDMCGVVVDGNSSKLKTGTRVMSIFNQSHLTGQVTEADMATGLGLPLPGVLTEYRCFPVESLVLVPEYMTDEEAACLPIAAVTAWMCINGMRPLGQPADGSRKETVLLQGTGGVSVAGLQIAKAAGLKTIITSSSDEKLERAKKDLGADFGINYQTHWEWPEPVLKETNGAGVDIIFETGGARTLRKSFQCVSFGGLINCVGYLSGKEDEDAPGARQLNINVLALRRNVTLKGILNGPKDRFEEMVQFYTQHKIRPVVSHVFKMDDAGDAFNFLFSGGHFGKVVIKVADK